MPSIRSSVFGHPGINLLSYPNLRVLIAVANLADASTGKFWPAIETIAHRAGLDYRETRRAIASLEKLGWIKTIEKRRGKGLKKDWPTIRTITPPDVHQFFSDHIDSNMKDGERAMDMLICAERCNKAHPNRIDENEPQSSGEIGVISGTATTTEQSGIGGTGPLITGVIGGTGPLITGVIGGTGPLITDELGNSIRGAEPPINQVMRGSGPPITGETGDGNVMLGNSIRGPNTPQAYTCNYSNKEIQYIHEISEKPEPAKTCPDLQTTPAPVAPTTELPATGPTLTEFPVASVNLAVQNKPANPSSNPHENLCTTLFSEPILPAAKVKSKSKTANPIPEDPNAPFNRFWAAWPKHHRKADRTKCWENWDKNNLNDQIKTILKKVKGSIRSEMWQSNNGQFVPAPLVWLNKRQYDAPTPPPAASEDDASDWQNFGNYAKYRDNPIQGDMELIRCIRESQHLPPLSEKELYALATAPDYVAA